MKEGDIVRRVNFPNNAVKTKCKDKLYVVELILTKPKNIGYMFAKEINSTLAIYAHGSKVRMADFVVVEQPKKEEI